jgi:hypothetical protein
MLTWGALAFVAGVFDELLQLDIPNEESKAKTSSVKLARSGVQNLLALFSGCAEELIRSTGPLYFEY